MAGFLFPSEATDVPTKITDLVKGDILIYRLNK
jgi:hypothetical protein